MVPQVRDGVANASACVLVGSRSSNASAGELAICPEIKPAHRLRQTGSKSASLAASKLAAGFSLQVAEGASRGRPPCQIAAHYSPSSKYEGGQSAPLGASRVLLAEIKTSRRGSLSPLVTWTARTFEVFSRAQANWRKLPGTGTQEYPGACTTHHRTRPLRRCAAPAGGLPGGRLVRRHACALTASLRHGVFLRSVFFSPDKTPGLGGGTSHVAYCLGYRSLKCASHHSHCQF